MSVRLLPPTACTATTRAAHAPRQTQPSERPRTLQAAWCHRRQLGCIRRVRACRRPGRELIPETVRQSSCERARGWVYRDVGVGRAAAVWVNLTNEDAVRSGGKAALHCALGVLRQREQPQWQQRQAPANQNSYELPLRETTASHESHLAIYAGVCQRQRGGGDGAGQKRAAVLNHAAEEAVTKRRREAAAAAQTCSALQFRSWESDASRG
jgi:hypothetical protein